MDYYDEHKIFFSFLLATAHGMEELMNKGDLQSCISKCDREKRNL